MNKWIQIKASADNKVTEINIDGAIGGGGWFEPDGVTKCDIKAELIQIAAIKGDVIKVNINSLGGDINDGISIHDLLAQNPAKKIVYINGMTASAATVIAMAGDEINMSENALFLVHRGSLFACGNVNDIKVAVQDLEKVDGVMAKVYAKKTGKTVEEILAKMDANNGNGEWMDATEAKEFGFITGAFEPTKMAAYIDRAAIAKLKLPEIPEEKIHANNNLNFIEMKKSILASIKDLFTGANIKFTPKAENTGIDIVTDQGTLHIDTAETAAKVGDIAMKDGAPAPAGDYIVNADESVITIIEGGVISAIESKQDETQEDAEQMKAKIEALKSELSTEKEKVATLTAKANEENDNEKVVLANVEALTKQYEILAKSITSSGFEMPKEVTIFNKRKDEGAKAGEEAAERRKNYKK